MFTKVHLIFENNHLLARDKSDFESYWLLLGYGEDKIEYHVGCCGFKPAVGELVIVDEADTFMLGDPVGFATFIDECCCLCFTATPDNCDAKGTEAKVISALKFHKYSYLLDNQNIVVDLTFDEVITCSSAIEKAAYIKECSRGGPVLVFCSADLTF